MPYSIVTQDDITIDNIPDNIAPDAPELKARVAAIRASRASGAAPPAPSAQQQAQPEASLGSALKSLVTDRLLAPAETIGRLAYGAASMPIAGLAGMAQGAYNIGREAAGLPPGLPAAEVVQNVTGALGAPVTEGAQQVEEALGKLIVPAQEFVRKPGEMIAEAGFPAVGAVVSAIPETALTLAAPEVRGAFRSVATTPFIRPGAMPPPVPPPVVPPGAPPPVAPPPVPPVLPTASGAAEVIDLARRAGGTGPGAAAAKEELARMANVNLEAKAAAERLGIDLPIDVFAENPQVRSAVGLTRSEVASNAEGAWEKTVRAALNRSDEVIQQFDANFQAGRPSTGAVSQKVVDALAAERTALNRQAATLHQEVKSQVSPSTFAPMNNLRTYLDDMRSKLGENGKFTAPEQKLWTMISNPTEPGLTYFALNAERDLIGKAIAGQESPYGNMSTGRLKDLYGAIKQDQLDAVEAAGGQALRAKQRSADLLTQKQKALENRIVHSFGTEIDGSIAQKLQSAVTTASKGDAAGFNRVMKVVPDSLKKEALSTAFAHVIQGKAVGAGIGSEVAFSPAEFVKTYRGLRANPPVYSEMVRIMGPEWDQTMRDLYTISRKVADAQSRVILTGKANQILAHGAVDGLIGRIMSSGVSQRVATATVGQVPGAAFFAKDLIDWMQNTKGAAVQRASKVFASPEFEQLAVEAAQRGGQPTPAALRRVATSKAFSDFAKSAALPVGVNGRVDWLRAAIQGGISAGQQQQQQTEQ